MQTKVCSKCGADKPETEFFIRANGALKTPCKKCCLARNKIWMIKNPESAALSRSKRDRTADAEYSIRYRKQHPDVVLRTARTVRDEARDAYVARQLGMPVSSIPRPLLEAKRIQLQITRLLRERKA